MATTNLFPGIAVLIDDEIDDEASNIRKIQAQIEKDGCHVLGMKSIPDAAQLSNLTSASFFVVDWNLYGKALTGGEDVPTATLPGGLQKEYVIEMITFLKDLKKVRFAPVFIFTNEDVGEIVGELHGHPELYDESDPSHIKVVSKNDVLTKGVFAFLEEWLQHVPSAYVLKRWEIEYEKAKNALFLDFYTKSVHWPLVLKKTFEEADVSPSVELGNLIGHNLLSRMTPFEFDLDTFDDSLLESLNAGSYRETLLKVLEGERFLPESRLHKTSVSAGDIFKDGNDYYVNLRPECDCIPRGDKNLDDIELYLLKGSKWSASKVANSYNAEYGRLPETDPETVIFAIADGKTISFRMKDLTTARWGTWKGKRIGRLLPPFLTRLQQRYAAYLQRPGMTRIPKAAVDLSSAASHTDGQGTPQDQGPSAGWKKSAMVAISWVRGILTRLEKRLSSRS